MLEGVKEVYAGIKANAITPADVEATMATQMKEFEAKLTNFTRAQEQARAGLEQERAMLLAQQDASREELAKAKVRATEIFGGGWRGWGVPGPFCLCKG